MRVTIIADDGKVGVDGVFRAVDLAALDPKIHAVQWDGAKGHIEYKDRSPETVLTDISPYQFFVDAWTVVAPRSIGRPHTPGERSRLKLRAMASNTKGMDITCGCKSPSMKLKNGNSVMV